ncbi:M50 family metallopeptidase [Streptomyces scabiei]
MSSEQVAWEMYAKLSARDRRAVDAWRDLGNDVVTSLLNADVLRSAAPTRFPVDDTADWARRSLGLDPALVRQEAAEHEAAHAVVARALGVHVREVTIAEDGSGATVYQETSREAEAVIAVAPQVWLGEFRALVFPAGSRGCSGDNRTLARSTGADAYNVDQARRRARLILGEQRGEVLELARQLAKSGRVTF